MTTTRLFIFLLAITTIIGCSSPASKFEEGPSLDFKISSSASLEDYEAHMLARQVQLEELNKKMDEEMQEALNSGADREELKKKLLEVFGKAVRRSDDIYQQTLKTEVPEEAKKLHEGYVTTYWALKENLAALKLMAEEKVDESEGEKRQALLNEKATEGQKIVREESERLGLDKLKQ